MAENTHLENLRAEDKSGSDWWFPLKPVLLCLERMYVTPLYALAATNLALR